MPTLDELLNTSNEVATCTVNPDTREIIVPEKYKILGVFSDEKVTKIPFTCPKVVGNNVDLTEYKLYINYQNASGGHNAYLIDDVAVSGDNITFSWLLSRDVTLSSGVVKYSLCAKKLNGDLISNEWNTTIANGVVIQGLEVTQAIIEENSDIIEAILLKAHTHANKDLLDKLSVSNGKLQYDGSDAGLKGDKGTDGTTPHIGDNGNWYLGTTDTGKPSRGVQGDPGKNGSDASVTEANITGALGYKPAAPGDIPMVPTAEINANTAARHSHTNKNVLDSITAADKTKLDGVEDGATKTIVDTAMSDTSTNPVQNKVLKKYIDDHSAGTGGAANAVLYTAQELTFEQKQRARNNIEALPVAGPTTTGTVSMCPDHITDSNAAVHFVPSKVNDSDYTITLNCGPENWPVRVKGIRTPADTDNNAAANVEYVKAKVAGATVDTEMSDTSTNAVQNKVIKKYVDAAIEPYIIDSTVASDWQSFVQFGSTFEEIYAAIQAGKNVILAMHTSSVSNYVRYAPVTFATPHSIYFYWAQALDTDGAMLSYKEAVITNANATQLNSVSLVGLNNDDALPQITMASAPEEDMQIATKQYVDDHSGGTMVALSGTVEGEVTGYTSTTYQQIVDEIAKNGNIWLTINGETIRLASWKQSGSTYKLVFFGAGNGVTPVKYEVTASTSSASLTVTGS